VRGFLSTAGKKPGVRIESSKNDSGDRVYRIAKLESVFSETPSRR
jgi:hypothetical protein